MDFKSTTGTIHPWAIDAEDAALVESARADLPCAADNIVVRHIGIYRSPWLHVADGCGMRGVYWVDCSGSRVQSGAPGHANVTNRPMKQEGLCECVLISRLPAPQPPS
jgi:hypothetical protein